MSEPTSDLWLLGVRAAGALHFITLGFAWFTPIPPDWDQNLAMLPDTHRRFAIAQNVFIGGVIAFCGLLCLCCAPELISGSKLARFACGGIALWWGGRLVILPWLGVFTHLRSAWLRLGFAMLAAECTVYAAAFAWLAAR